jgi:hypothetical protein
MRKLLLALALSLLTLPAQAGSQLLTSSGAYAMFTAVNMNSANTDNQITHIPWAQYIVRRITIFGCSTSLGATSTATIGVFTGAGGTGTTVVTNATITGMTGVTKYNTLTLAETDDALQATSIYVRIGTAQGGAATCSFSIEVTPLS